jgi:FAD/FMN-containing dehydrogenase/NAD-dependent dihydropyrimidine dehydrogenase PreA subunit
MHDVSTAIEHDLHRIIKGPVLFDDVTRTLYSTAACLFEIVPMGCVVPMDADDLQNLVHYCSKHRIPITGRGAGTSLAGQAIGSGIVIDFSRLMNQIVEIDTDRGWARVQPGIVLETLNTELKKHGFFFPPDPSSKAMCTVGGMIQTNAGGVHSLKYGTTRDYLIELEAIFDNGEKDAVRNERARKKFSGRYGDIFSKTVRLLSEHGEVIEKEKPAAPKNSSGYHVYDVVQDGTARIQRLIGGSEGTLALVSEAKVSIRKLPRHRVLALLVFPDSDAACEPTAAMLQLEPSALELMDSTTVKMVNAFDRNSKLRPNGSVVLCEFDGDSPKELLDRARRLKKFCKSVTIVPEKDYASLWTLRRAVSPALERMPGKRRSTRVIEDACVDPSRVPEYIRGLKEILKSHRREAAIFGHLGSGNIHVNVFLDLNQAKDIEIMSTMSFQAAELIRKLRGSLSGEHGDGLLRAPELRRQFPALYPVFEQIKEIWDPVGIFNPGKKLCEKGYRFTQDLRASRRPGFRTSGPFRRAEAHLQKCNGCGKCRDYCPLFEEKAVEFSSPRAKVNLLLAAGESRMEASTLLSDPVLHDHLRECLTCRKCLSDCPAGVDMPAIGSEFLRVAKEKRA